LSAAPLPSDSKNEKEIPNLYKAGQLCEAYYAADGKWFFILFYFILKFIYFFEVIIWKGNTI